MGSQLRCDGGDGSPRRVRRSEVGAPVTKESLKVETSPLTVIPRGQGEGEQVIGVWSEAVKIGGAG